jgi:Flp pilus assembly protein CpaB
MARRRLLAAVAAALAVLVGLQAASPAPVRTRLVVTAARDLPAGAVVGRGDLTRTPFLPASVPTGAVTEIRDVLGRTTTGPVRQGEPITDVRLLTGSVLGGYPGRVAVPVRVADPAAVTLLRVGDRVDVMAADPQGHSEAVVVASRAPVVALPRAEEAALASGGLVVLAVSATTARALATAAVSGYLSVAITD